MHKTTAYHPQANGMVERLHRQLKCALKARTTDSCWMDNLPMVLLALRVAWRKDPDCSPAELVYGSSLRLPGEFVDPTLTRTSRPTSTFLQDLQHSMRSAHPTPPVYHNTQSSYVPNNLSQTGYVYVRIDSHRSSLQRPYEGPFRIIATADKYFELDINGRFQKISIDRLKPAYVQATHLPNQTISPQVSTPQPTVDGFTTRRGRLIRRPQYLNDHYVDAMASNKQMHCWGGAM